MTVLICFAIIINLFDFVSFCALLYSAQVSKRDHSGKKQFRFTVDFIKYSIIAKYLLDFDFGSNISNERFDFLFLVHEKFW